MVRGVIGKVGLATVVVLAACSEPQEQSGLDPSFKVVSATACDPNVFNSLIAGYFPSGQQNGIVGLKNQLLALPTTDPARLALGYEIMDSIGKWSRNGLTTLSASALLSGSNLTKALIKCTYNAGDKTEFPGFPDSVLYSFDKALNAPAGGAYYVRPQDSGDDTTSAVGRSTGSLGNLSGIAPPIQEDGLTPFKLSWGTILTERVLIYGWPEPGDAFEWALIRPNTIFSPPARVALCTGTVPENTIVEESNIGFLAWAGNAVDICSAAQSLTMESGWGLRGLAFRLARLGKELVTPQPLHASLATSGGTGTVRTLKSKLSFGEVEGIKLKLISGPRAVERVGQQFPIQVFAFTVRGTPLDPDTVGINNICVLLTGFANNGQTSTLTGNPANNCDSPSSKQLARVTETTDILGKPKAGYVTFGVTVGSAGAMIISVQSAPNEPDNLDQTVTGTSTAKFNVKP
jgi:hypothetical protein